MPAGGAAGGSGRVEEAGEEGRRGNCRPPRGGAATYRTSFPAVQSREAAAWEIAVQGAAGGSVR